MNISFLEENLSNKVLYIEQQIIVAEKSKNILMTYFHSKKYEGLKSIQISKDICKGLFIPWRT